MAAARTRDPVFGMRRAWFVGIGGSGMRGLASIMKARGATCAGTDTEGKSVADSLAKEGIAVHSGDPAELPRGIDLVVHSAAVDHNHPHLLAAQDRGIEVLTYAEALGRAMEGRTGVSIAGTHGKSTTTALLAHALMSCGLDPSFIVGAHCPDIGGGARTGAAAIPRGDRSGQAGIMVAEACEFNRSFHSHRPTIALINNVEEDHLDCYASLDEIVQSFREFARRLPAAADGGQLLIGEQGAHRRAVASGLDCQVSTFGWSPGADYPVQMDTGSNEVVVTHRGAEILRFTTELWGEHNALNAAAAGIIALWLGAPRSPLEAALCAFKGVDRRMQHLGDRVLPLGRRVRIFDDYGHHPTEVEKTLRALKSAHSPKRLVCVFQPHQHSRTRFLLEQFAQSFSNADVVIVPHIYFVRDSEIERTRVSAGDLVDRLRSKGVCAMHLYPFEAIVEQLEVMCQDGDLVVVMGAGPVWTVGRDFLSRGSAAKE